MSDRYMLDPHKIEGIIMAGNKDLGKTKQNKL